MGSSSSTANATARVVSSLTTIASLKERMTEVSGGAISEGKSKLLRTIAEALKTAGYIKENVGSMTDDEIAKALTKAKTDSSGQRVAQKFQKKTAEAVAKAINSFAGSEVIDMKLPENVLASKCAEFIESASADLGKEFVTARADLNVIMKNMDFICDLFEKVAAKLSSVPELKGDGGVLVETFLRMTTEMKKQLAMLRSVTDTELAKVDALKIEDGSEIHSLIRRLSEASTGSSALGTDLLKLLVTVGDYAYVQKLVNDALKKTGISLKELESVKTDPKKLEDIYSQKVSGKISSFSAEEVNKVEKAMNILREVLPSLYNPELVAVLGSAERHAGQHGHHVVHGGANLDKRIEKREKAEKILATSFERDFKRLALGVFTAIEAVTRDIEHDRVEINDDLELFMRTIAELPELTQTNSHGNLSGETKDSLGDQERVIFLGKCRFVVEVIDRMLKKKRAESLVDLKKYFESLIALVTSFSEKFNEGFGPIDAKFTTDSFKEGGDDGDPETFGGNSGRPGISGGGIYATIIKHANKFASAAASVSSAVGSTAASVKEAVAKVGESEVDSSEYEGGKEGHMPHKHHHRRSILGGYSGEPGTTPMPTTVKEFREKILYFLRLAKIKHGLKKVGKEMDSYADGYEKMKGDAIAGEIDRLNGEKKAYVDSVEARMADANSTWNALVAAGTATKEEVKEAFDRVKIFLKDYFDARIKLWQAAEALDTMLMKFTREVVLNINEFDDLLKVLSSVEIVTKWVLKVDKLEALDRYFAAPHDVACVADPRKPKYTVSEAFNLLDASFARWSALGNVMSAFATVGEEFGKTKISQSSFMKPGGMYDIMVNFMKFGSLEIVGDTRPAGPPPAAPVPTQFEDVNGANFGAMAGLACAGVQLAQQWTGKERTLFKHMVHAVAAKVLVAVDAVNMLKHVSFDHSMGYNSGLRFILGGADEHVKIIPEAVELYVRLVLLAEFYRDLFDFNPNVESIDMLPESSTSQFSRLIYVVFDKCKDVKEGNYPSADVMEMIAAINKIWAQTSGDNKANDIIEEFVADVNRRIGLYTREQKRKYADRKSKMYEQRAALANPEELESVNYEVEALKDTSMNGAAPSNKYVNNALGRGAAGTTAHKASVGHYDVVTNLRQKLFGLMQGAMQGTNDLANADQTTSFRQFMAEKLAEVHGTSNEQERLNIVITAITSLNRFNVTTLDKSIVALHEVVLAPLAALCAAMSYVDGLVAGILTMSQDAVAAGAPGAAPAVANAARPYALAKALADLCDKSSGMFDMQLNVSPGKFGVIIDSSGFKKYVAEAIGDVRTRFEKFRGVIPSEVLDRYVKLNGLNVTLTSVELYIRGFVKGEITDADRRAGVQSLDDILNAAVSALSTLTAFNHVPEYTQAFPAGAMVRAAPGLDVASLPFALSALTKLNAATVGANAPLNVNTRAVADRNLTITEFGSGVPRQPILTDFNNVLMLYMDLIFDKATSKVYSAYLEPLMAGPMSTTVVDKTHELAILPGGAMAPDNNNDRYVYALLSRLIYALYAVPRVAGKPDLLYMETDINALPSTYKERIRVNAPFIAEYARRVIAAFEVYSRFLTLNNAPAPDVVPANVNNMIEIMRNLQGSMKNMMREVGEVAEFMEVVPNFTADYKDTNKKEPFRPVSAMLDALCVYTANPITHENVFYRLVNQGSYESKLKRGLVAVLSDKKVDAGSVVEGHNKTTDALHKVEAGLASSAASTIQQAARYMMLGDRASILGLVPPLIDLRSILYEATLNGNVMKMVRMVESPEQKEAKSEMIAHVGAPRNLGAAVGTTRADMRVFNVIDSCVNVINFNALARDIPLVHMYNYATAFKRYVMKVTTEGVNVDRVLAMSVDFSEQKAPLRDMVKPSVLTAMHTPKFVSLVYRSAVLSAHPDYCPVLPMLAVTQIQRILRLSVFNGLMYYDQTIVKGIPIASPEITETNERFAEVREAEEDAAKLADAAAKLADYRVIEGAVKEIRDSKTVPYSEKSFLISDLAGKIKDGYAANKAVVDADMAAKKRQVAAFDAAFAPALAAMIDLENTLLTLPWSDSVAVINPAVAAVAPVTVAAKAANCRVAFKAYTDLVPARRQKFAPVDNILRAIENITPPVAVLAPGPLPTVTDQDRENTLAVALVANGRFNAQTNGPIDHMLSATLAQIPNKTTTGTVLWQKLNRLQQITLQP